VGRNGVNLREYRAEPLLQTADGERRQQRHGCANAKDAVRELRIVVNACIQCPFTISASAKKTSKKLMR